MASSQLGLAASKTVPARQASEFELLCACCRGASSEPGLSQVLASPLNWDRVLALAEHHRLLPALYCAIRDRYEVPGSIHSVIRARYNAKARSALRFSAELARVLRHFEDRGIRALAHKGPALAEKLYGDPAMRQFGDLDLLVRARDVADARAALTELGYEAGIRLSPRQEKEFLCLGYEYSFGLNSEPHLLELQWQIVPRFYSIDFDMESLFLRSTELRFEGFSLRSLGDEDLMLVLCVHAAKHEWSQLGMLRDIVTMARFDLDWEWIAAEGRRLGIIRIMLISLTLAHQMLGSELPEQLTLCPEMSSAGALSSAFQLGLSNGVQNETESVRYFGAAMKVRERWQDRVRLAWRLAVNPSIREWQAVRLPDSLFQLYRAVRILRLAKRLVVNSAS